MKILTRLNFSNLSKQFLICSYGGGGGGGWAEIVKSLAIFAAIKKRGVFIPPPEPRSSNRGCRD